MAERESDWSPPEELTPEWMAKVDEDYLSPEERSQRIMPLVEEQTMYDTICFCVEYLGRVAVPGFFATNKELQQHVAKLGAMLYGLHYFQAPNILGPPDRTPELKSNMFRESIAKMTTEAREALFTAVEQIKEEEDARCIEGEDEHITSTSRPGLGEGGTEPSAEVS